MAIVGCKGVWKMTNLAFPTAVVKHGMEIGVWERLLGWLNSNICYRTFNHGFHMQPLSY